MPSIVIYTPRLTLAQKSATVAAVTEAFARGTGIDAEHLVIHIEEHPYGNVGVGGKLLTEIYPELAERDRQAGLDP